MKFNKSTSSKATRRKATRQKTTQQKTTLRKTTQRKAACLTSILVVAIGISVGAVPSLVSECWAQEKTPTSPASSTSPSRDQLLDEISMSYSALSQQVNLVKKVTQFVSPSVVHIEAVKIEQRNRSSRRVEEAGAGVLIQHEGQRYVITNRHVIVGASNANILLQLSDGRFFHPVKAMLDPGTDIAVLAVEGEDLVPCKIGDSDQCEIGDYVVAFGSPFGLNHSVSHGIISAKGRRDLQLGSEGVRYQDFIQTDAAINPGNSGGPLTNLRGEVIGINTAIASNSGANEGIGFTIPINMAQQIAIQLIENGRVDRAFLGVQLDSNFSHRDASRLGLNHVYGARVSGVTKGSPAQKALLATGDVILRFNGKLVENDSHLVQQVSLTPIGVEVPILIYRGGKNRTLQVKVTDRRLFDPR